jgi:hypothetical protein
MAEGIFDRKNTADAGPDMESSTTAPRQPRQEPTQNKEDFPTLSDGLKKTRQDIEQKNRMVKQKSPEEATAENINARMSGQSDQVAFEEETQISEEDVKLAETLLFNGYVETEVIMPHIPSIKHTICSVTAEEMNLIDEIIFEEAKKYTKSDGEVDISESAIQTLRSSLYIALSYKGSNGEDFIKGNRTIQLDILKKAMKALSDKYVDGDIENVDEFKASIIIALRKRAARVRQFGTPLMDFISAKKFEFDTKLFNVMNTDKIIPKS